MRYQVSYPVWTLMFSFGILRGFLFSIDQNRLFQVDKYTMAKLDQMATNTKAQSKTWKFLLHGKRDPVLSKVNEQDTSKNL